LRICYLFARFDRRRPSLKAQIVVLFNSAHQGGSNGGFGISA